MDNNLTDDRRAAILRRDEIRQPERQVVQSSRGQEVLKEVFDGVVNLSEPQNPFDRAIFEYNRISQENELQRIEIETLKNELVNLKSSTSATIVRLSDQLEALTTRNELLDKERNQFADYSIALATKLDGIVQVVDSNAKAVSDMIGDAKEFAQAAAFKKTIRPREDVNATLNAEIDRDRAFK